MPNPYTPWKRVPPQIFCRPLLVTGRPLYSLSGAFSSEQPHHSQPVCCRSAPALWSSSWSSSGPTHGQVHVFLMHSVWYHEISLCLHRSVWSRFSHFLRPLSVAESTLLLYTSYSNMDTVWLQTLTGGTCSIEMLLGETVKAQSCLCFIVDL